MSKTFVFLHFALLQAISTQFKTVGYVLSVLQLQGAE